MPCSGIRGGAHVPPETSKGVKVCRRPWYSVVALNRSNDLTERVPEQEMPRGREYDVMANLIRCFYMGRESARLAEPRVLA